MGQRALVASIGVVASFAPVIAQPYNQHIPTRSDRYTYTAQIIRVIDGDTVEADIDLGFHTWRRGIDLRLARVDAPEPKTDTREAGLAATEWLRKRVEGKWLIIRTIADRKGQEDQGKYGRYLVELFLDGTNLNDELVSAGHAVYEK